MHIQNFSPKILSLLWRCFSLFYLFVAAIVTFLVAYIRDLTWPKLGLIFLLMFPRQIKASLKMLPSIFDRVKSFDLAGIKGELNAAKESIKEASASQLELNQPISRSVESQLSESPVFQIRKDESSRHTPTILRELTSTKSQIGSELFEAYRRLPSPMEQLVTVSSKLPEMLRSMAYLNGLSYRNNGRVQAIANVLVNGGVLTPDVAESIRRFAKLRNEIIHGPAVKDRKIVQEAARIGMEIVSLLESIPRPVFVPSQEGVLTYRDEELTELVNGMFLVTVHKQQSGRSRSSEVPRLTSERFELNRPFVPTLKPWILAVGDFYYRLDEDPKIYSINGVGFDFRELYEIG
jgi:uncharacterized protein YutE (UPF0331/DUF86 family)